jgi:hypothetical protein
MSYQNQHYTSAPPAYDAEAHQPLMGGDDETDDIFKVANSSVDIRMGKSCVIEVSDGRLIALFCSFCTQGVFYPVCAIVKHHCHVVCLHV